MNYFITGASGFIGRRLVKKLFQQHPDCTVYFLMRPSHQDKLPALFAFWNVDESRAVPVFGDMTLIHPLIRARRGAGCEV
ncbi:SDR family oxidoreductase [Aeromonas australiensis]|uniref:SDR family oxidoreductase n=1 Tax=Aeromonas australiensis TaxID=1114880 RepID=UPI001F21E5A5|nr:SDR family oxidoreductase [Aeromonas australiensis]